MTSPLSCASCGSSNVRRLSLIYSEGFSALSATQQSKGICVGVVGGSVAVGIGTSEGRISGTTQSVLSAQAAPPPKYDFQPPSSPSNPLMVVAGIAAVVGILSIFATGMSWWATVISFAISFILFLCSGMTNPENIDQLRVRTKQTELLRIQWDEEKNGPYRKWEQTYMCLSCAHRFIPLGADKKSSSRIAAFTSDTKQVGENVTKHHTPAVISSLKSIQVSDRGMIAPGELNSPQSTLYHAIVDRDDVPALNIALRGISDAEIKDKSYGLLYLALLTTGPGGKPRLAVAAHLVARGADIHATSIVSASDIANESSKISLLGSAIAAGNVDVALWLLERHKTLSKIISTDHIGAELFEISLLSSAIAACKVDLALWLLQRHKTLPKLHAKPFMVVTAMNAEYLRLLEAGKKLGGNIDERGEGSLTPLIAAASHGNVSAVKYLLSVGANVNAVDYDGYSALSYAKCGPFHDIEELLINAGADLACDIYISPQ